MSSELNGIKLEFTYKKIVRKSLLLEINTLLNNMWVKEEVLKEILKYLELNEIENTPYHNLWDSSKPRKFRVGDNIF